MEEEEEYSITCSCGAKMGIELHLDQLDWIRKLAKWLREHNKKPECRNKYKRPTPATATQSPLDRPDPCTRG